MNPEQHKVVDRITKMLQGVDFTASEGLYLEGESDFVEVVTERRPPKSDNIRLRIHIGDYWLSSAIAWLRPDALDNWSRTLAAVAQKGEPVVSPWATTALRKLENSRKNKLESPYAKVPFRLRRKNADGTETIAGECTNSYGKTYIDGALAQDLCSIEVVREVLEENEFVVTLPPRLPVATHLQTSRSTLESAAATNDSQKRAPVELTLGCFSVVLEYEGEGRTSVGIQSSDVALKGKVVWFELNGVTKSVELQGNLFSPSCSGSVVVDVSFEDVCHSHNFRIVGEECA